MKNIYLLIIYSFIKICTVYSYLAYEILILPLSFTLSLETITFLHHVCIEARQIDYLRSPVTLIEMLRISRRRETKSGPSRDPFFVSARITYNPRAQNDLYEKEAERVTSMWSISIRIFLCIFHHAATHAKCNLSRKLGEISRSQVSPGSLNEMELRRREGEFFFRGQSRPTRGDFCRGCKRKPIKREQ